MYRLTIKRIPIILYAFLWIAIAACNYPAEPDDASSEAVTSTPTQENGGCSSELHNKQCYDSAYDMDGDCHMTQMAADSVCGDMLKNDYSEEEFETWLATYPWDCDDSDPEIWQNCLVPYMGSLDQSCEELFQQVYSQGYDAFLPFGASFDLDEGVIIGATDPTIDFTVNADPDGAGSTIEFIPSSPASFAFGGVFMFEPNLQQCESSSNLNTDTEVISIKNYYVPYRTNEGRYGYIYFKDYDAVTGLTFDWRTFEPAQCYDSAYDLDGDCCMDIMASNSACGDKIKEKYGQQAFDTWLETTSWDCDDSDPDICLCQSGCEEQDFNEKCYDSAYDMDGDCHMTQMAADSVCGYTLKNDYSEEEFDTWLATYPWDCDDSNPEIWSNCPVSADTLVPTPTVTLAPQPTATEKPPSRPTSETRSTATERSQRP